MNLLFRRGSLVAILLCLWLLAACGTAAPASVPTALPATAVPPTAAPTTAPTAVPPTATPTAAPTAAAPTPGSVTGAPITLTDAAGRTVTLPGIPQRIISLSPSTTEIAFALGLGTQLVAVDDFSDYPAEAKALPKIGSTNGVYNTEQIVALKPELVLAAGITAPDVIKQLESLKVPVLVLGSPQTTLESINNDILLAGKATGQDGPAQTLVTTMRQQLNDLKSTLSSATTKPLVYWELDATDATKPYSVGPGNFVNDIIELAGGTNAFASASSPYPQVSTEQIVAAKPEVIILSDAAYGVTVDSVAQRPGWAGIPAVKNQRIMPIDDNLVSRPGPRIIEGVLAAAKIIHPELFK